MNTGTATQRNNPALTDAERELYGVEAILAADPDVIDLAEAHADGCTCDAFMDSIRRYLDNRRGPNPHTLYEFPADQGVYTQSLNAGYMARALAVVNLTTSAFTITFDDRSVLPIQAGAVFVFVPPATQQLRVVSASAVAGTMRITTYANEPDLVIGGAIFSPGGGTGGAVTIADGADVALGTTTDLATASTVVGFLRAVKVALQGTLSVALAAGAAVIGKVQVVDSTGANNLAVDASGRVSILGITNALPTGANTIGAATSLGSNATAVVQRGTDNAQTVSQRGALQAVGSAVTAGASATLVIARPTRRKFTVVNNDATNAVWISPTATATAANSVLLLPKAAIDLTGVMLWSVLAVAGTPALSIIDEFD